MSRENLGRKRMKKENSRQKPTLVLRARLQAGFPDAPRRRLSGAFRRGRPETDKTATTAGLARAWPLKKGAGGNQNIKI